MAGCDGRESGGHCLPFALASAVIDNVPLVAASRGMYSLAEFPPNSFLWGGVAYAAGTGGFILVIGSAAGVVAMSREEIVLLVCAED